jgi:hypothetical protein
MQVVKMGLQADPQRWVNETLPGFGSLSPRARAFWL